MSFSLLLICSQNGVPRKFIEVDEKELKRDDRHVDGMHRAFMTPNSPIRMEFLKHDIPKKKSFKFN